MVSNEKAVRLPSKFSMGSTYEYQNDKRSEGLGEAFLLGRTLLQ